MTEPAIRLRVRIEAASNASAKRFYGRLTLTDHGDHVQGTDGRKTWRWRLAD